ncbi:MAG: metallophosphoesterase, partial [Methyloceanibacter sp.]
ISRAKEVISRIDVGPESPEAPVWMDYVADLGDGFDATYAIAYLIGQPSLQMDGHELPRGSLVVMGGDEVYPYATTRDYVLRTRYPYGFALPFAHQIGDCPLVMAIPGNHDWYDGLARFLAIFCRKESTPIGGWRTKQRRSYFAVRLSRNWWLWGIDIALIEDMDQPQKDYFTTIAGEMQGANLILCSSEPGWYNAAPNSESFRSLGYAAWIAKKANKNIRIALCLSGDTHHYARYSTDFGTEFMTAGGGGAFLHGTHQLPPELKLDWFKHHQSSVSLVKKNQTGRNTAPIIPISALAAACFLEISGFR